MAGAGEFPKITGDTLYAQDCNERMWNNMVVVGQDDLDDFDGTDEVPINDAITYALANGFGVVLIRGGTYTINNPILINDHITIRGEGQEFTILKAANGFDDYIIQINSTKTNGNQWRVNIEDLKINGDMANQAAGGGIIGYGCIQSNFNRVHLENCYDEAIMLWDCEGGSGDYGHHNHVFQCLIDQGESSGGDGIGVYMKNNDENTLSMCDFQYNKIGVKDETGFNHILGCSFVDGQTGLYLLDCSRTQVTNCVFDKCAYYGLHLKAAFCVIGNNTFYAISDGNAGVYSCIYVDWYGSNVINGCTFQSHETTGMTRSGIREIGNIAEDTHGNNLITGNAFLSVSGATTLTTTQWGTAALEEVAWAAAYINRKSNNYHMTSAGGAAV